MTRSRLWWTLSSLPLLIWGCRPQTDAPRPSLPDLRSNLLLLTHDKTTTITGNAQRAGAYEVVLDVKTLDAVEQKEIAQLTAHGWKPLKKNMSAWKEHPIPNGRILGYYKSGLYYMIYIHPDPAPRKHAFTIAHDIEPSLAAATNTGMYFLPEN